MMAWPVHGNAPRRLACTPKRTRAIPDVPRSPPKPVITNGKRYDILMHSHLELIISSISDKYHAQQMQLEVKMQAKAGWGVI